MSNSELIERWMPVWDFNSFHSVSIKAPAEVVYQGLKELDLSELWLTKFLFLMRGIPALVIGRRDRKPLRLTLEGLQDAGFVILDEDQGREIVLGLLGRPWVPTGDIRRVTAKEFQEAEDPELAKVVWNFALEEADGVTQLTTETRALSLSERAKRNFGKYWRLIAPFSSAIRVNALSAVKRRAERRYSQQEINIR